MSNYEEYIIGTDTVQGFQKISFSGTIIYGHSENVKVKIISLLRESHDHILDLRKLQLIDSIGFGVLIHIANKLKQLQSRMVIILTDDSLKKLFSIIRLESILPIVQSEQEALRVLSEQVNSTHPNAEEQDY